MTDRTITIYGREDRPIGKHSDVIRLRLPFSGHLVVHTVDYTMTYAAGMWQTFSDTLTVVPVVPGPAPTDPTPPADPFLSVPRAPHSAEVHEAMQIHCCCEQIRCPVVMNEATSGDRKWWQLRGHYAHGVAGASAAAPLQRCVHELGHDTAELPHEWFQGGWPYGPAQHHPACPRNPEVYNRRPLTEGEGQPQHAAGVTRSAEPTEDGRAAVDAPTRVMTGPVGHHARPASPCGIEDHPAVSHYCRGPGGIPVAYPHTQRIEPGNSGPGGPLPPLEPVPATHNLAERHAWNSCALWYPEHHGRGRETLWCTWPADHAGGTHSTTTEGGDRLYW